MGHLRQSCQHLCALQYTYKNRETAAAAAAATATATATATAATATAAAAAAVVVFDGAQIQVLLHGVGQLRQSCNITLVRVSTPAGCVLLHPSH
jgi:hypothetical protein